MKLSQRRSCDVAIFSDHERQLFHNLCAVSHGDSDGNRAMLRHHLETMTPSRQQLVHNMPMHVGEPEAAALVLEGELRVVDAQQVQDGGLQVVDVDGAGREVVFRGCDRVGLSRRRCCSRSRRCGRR